MKSSMRKTVATACIAGLLGGAAWQSVDGQAAPVPVETRAAGAATEATSRPHWDPPAQGAPITLTISPRATERPALQFALLPKSEETEKGNAAIKYITAATTIPELKPDELDYWTSAARYAPLSALRAEDATLKSLRDRFHTTLQLMHDGARLESADWETDVRQAGISAMLPSLGKMRTLATALQMEIRFDIQRHDWPAACEKIKTGYAFALHLGQGETIIESLVGISVAAQMNACVQDWIAEPGSPNLYWPLSNLPAPFNTMRRAFWMERGFAYFSMPELKEMKAGHYSREAWISMLSKISEVGAFSGGSTMAHFAGENAPPWQREALTAAYAAVIYPEAKNFLEERGFSKDSVDAMPSYEVVERYFVRSYEEDLDEAFKWSAMSPADAARGLQAADKQLAARDAAGMSNLLARLLVPSLGRVKLPVARADRQIAMLRVVEVLRAYAAANSGRFPASLNALVDLGLPVPNDPWTGAPFVYETSGTAASITSNAEDPKERMRFDLAIRK